MLKSRLELCFAMCLYNTSKLLPENRLLFSNLFCLVPIAIGTKGCKLLKTIRRGLPLG